MAIAKKRTIFLSTRPQVELPFAAEVNLQVYDSSLKAHGFLDLEITNNPMASHHWHPEYENFRLRWLSSSQATKVEVVGLLWTHGSQQKSGLAICIRGRIDDRRNDGVGQFRALNIGISSRVVSSETWIDDFVQKFSKDKNVHQTGPDKLSMDAKCSVNLEQPEDGEGSRIEVSAQLRQQDIFGNDIYTLTIVVNN
jgi:hypothetical protein